MSLAWAGPGDIVLVPDPAFPVYKMSTILAGAEPYPVPLLEEDGYLPDLDAIPADVIQRAKILYLNYPNNPTGAIATPEFFARVARWGADHEVMVAHDLAYSEMVLDPGLEMPSLLAAPGAMDVGVEFHSLSKTMNMTGWRIGVAVGHAGVIGALAHKFFRYF
jgi:LL-diaminopimelate aminotransferase